MAMSRSENMRRIRSSHTGPEVRVRQILRQIGFSGYRLHRADLPGKPDIAFLGKKKAIFVHGCFWHGHNCKEGVRKPKSNQGYWLPKIERNQQRDAEHVAALEAAGWRILTVWDCEVQAIQAVTRDLARFMKQK